MREFPAHIGDIPLWLVGFIDGDPLTNFFEKFELKLSLSTGDIFRSYSLPNTEEGIISSDDPALRMPPSITVTL